MQGADITVGDIIGAIEEQVGRGLEARGFRVAAGERRPDRELELKLRAFKFFIETGFWTAGENVSVVINAEAKNGGDDPDRTYRFSSEERGIGAPTGSAIDEKLNYALSQVLTDIVSDKELMRFLAR